jgi:hypothetical protein
MSAGKFDVDWDWVASMNKHLEAGPPSRLSRAVAKLNTVLTVVAALLAYTDVVVYGAVKLIALDPDLSTIALLAAPK